jgi:hypothetical protein
MSWIDPATILSGLTGGDLEHGQPSDIDEWRIGTRFYHFIGDFRVVTEFSGWKE